MRVILAALITVILAFSATAVDIDVFTASVACNVTTASIRCMNVPAQACCIGGGDIFSARCSNLGVGNNFCTVAVGPAGDRCQTACRTVGGAVTICVDPGTCPAGTGASWLALPVGVVKPTADQVQCKQSIKPDRAMFANGRSFRINYDVPEDVTGMLIELVKTDPLLSQGAPGAALPYEIKANEG